MATFTLEKGKSSPIRTRKRELMHQKINLLLQRIQSGQAVNDLNWLRLRGWRETLAMVFDPLQRRNSLENRKNTKPPHIFKEPLPPLVPLQPINHLSDEEGVKVERYIQISGYFDGSKITDLGTRLVRELIR